LDFRLTAFSEVQQEEDLKYHSFGGCACYLMLATVVALYYAAGLPLVPLLRGRSMEEVSARTRLFAYLGVAIGVIAGLYFDWPF
jgi:NADH:ubiquinone oxidoreductase subunit 2 (subunit N)